MSRPELQALLELDGLSYGIGGGYWVKFSVKAVSPNRHIPHGIKYSLTLHHKSGTRLVGFDNAHAPTVKRPRFSGRREEWDHNHNRSVISDYVFESPGQLLEDFWEAVDRLLAEEGMP